MKKKIISSLILLIGIGNVLQGSVPPPPPPPPGKHAQGQDQLPAGYSWDDDAKTRFDKFLDYTFQKDIKKDMSNRYEIGRSVSFFTVNHKFTGDANIFFESQLRLIGSDSDYGQALSSYFEKLPEVYDLFKKYVQDLAAKPKRPSEPATATPPSGQPQGSTSTPPPPPPPGKGTQESAEKFLASDTLDNFVENYCQKIAEKIFNAQRAVTIRTIREMMSYNRSVEFGKRRTFLEDGLNQFDKFNDQEKIYIFGYVQALFDSEWQAKIAEMIEDIFDIVEVIKKSQARRR